MPYRKLTLFGKSLPGHFACIRLAVITENKGLAERLGKTPCVLPGTKSRIFGASPKRANAPSSNIHIDYSDSQIPPSEEHLFHDPEYPIEEYAS